MLVIDADIVLYSCGFATDGEPVSHSCSNVKKLLTRIMDQCQHNEEDTIVLLTGKDNFRDEVATILPYKGNRLDAPKPSNYKEMKDYLINVWDAQVVEGEEADDMMGKLATDPLNDDVIIATLDKDLAMIPGVHYNWRKDEFVTVTEEEGERAFIKQLLTGDATDNIPGLKKITGKVASAKCKAWCTEEGLTREEMMDRVVQTYVWGLQFVDDEAPTAQRCEVAKDILTEIGTLLWMRRSDVEDWPTYYGLPEINYDWQESSKKEGSKTKSPKNPWS